MIAVLKYVAIAGAAGGLAAVYVLGGWWPLALPAAAVGLLWALGSWRGRRWPAGLGLFLLVCGAGVAAWLGLGLIEDLLVVVAALSAWDLDHAQALAREVPRTAAVVRLERGHLLRLLLVDGVSVVVAGVAGAFRLQLGVGLAILLGVLVVCAVGEAVAFFRRESD